MVNTKAGKAFICADKIEYAAGKFCSKYRKVRKHLNMRRKRTQIMRNSMDYIYTSGEQKIVIEVEQKSVRQSVAEQYVRSRKMQGLTQAELAKRAGVPRSNITRFESGNYNPSLEMMVRIAEALGMTLQVQLTAKE